MFLKRLAKRINNIHIINYFYKYAFPPLRVELFSYNNSKKSQIFDKIKEIKRETSTLISYTEGCQLYMLVKNTRKIKGDIAEVGVYKGGTAKILCEAKAEKTLHLFDTFEGMPETKGDPLFSKGDFRAAQEEVQNYLKQYPNVYFYKGFFPQTAKHLKKKTFSLVHLDVDLYESTINSLKYFYSRMSKGGIIITHDYPNAEGVARAFDEFFKNKPESVIEMPTSQCLIVKM